MNICFLIDNSITMIQKAYNGLSILEIAKSYVQKTIESKGFSRFTGAEHLNYHLFVSSSNAPLSTYQHQQLHFTNQLKFVSPSGVTDLPETIKDAFKQLNKYRQLFGCETLMGNIEPFKPRSSIVIILTDSSDMLSLTTIQNRIKSGQLKCQYDCQVYIVRICPPSFFDKPSYQGIRKSVENDQSSVLMRQIAEYWNGKYFHVHRHQYGFEVIENIINTFSPKIFIKFEVIQKTPLVPNFRQSGISSVERNKDPSFLSKNEFVVSSIKSGPRKSRIPLPVYPPKVRGNLLNILMEVEDFHLPSYSIDVSKAFDYPMNEYMPFQKLELEPSQLSAILQQRIEKLRIEKLYVPVYLNYEQKLITIGLIKINNNKPLEFMFYLPNFIEFNSIFQFMLQRKTYDKLSMNSFEITVQEYIRKIPPVYDNYVYELIFNRGYKVDTKSRVPEQLMKLQQQMENSQYLQRKAEGDKLANNSKVHQKYISECCPVYSNFYEKWCREHTSLENEDESQKDISQSIQNLLELKKLIFPHLDDEIKLDDVKTNPIALELSNYSLKSGNQNQPLGNPYKKKRKVDEININIDPIPPPPKIQIQQPKLQQQKRKEVEMVMEVQQPAAKQPQLTDSQSSEQKLQKKQQQYVSRFLSYFAVSKPIQLKMSVQNLCIEQYEANSRILQQNNIV